MKRILPLLGCLFLAVVLTVPAMAATQASVSGVIETINLSKKKIRVETADGSSVLVRITAATAVERNGAVTRLRNLALRDSVSVTYDKATRRASLVSAGGPEYSLLRGKVRSVNELTGVMVVKTAAGRVSVGTNSGTRISRNGRVVPLGMLTVKDTVVIARPATGPLAATGSDDDCADSIVCSGPHGDEVKGTITAIVDNQVTIAPRNGVAPVTVTVDATTCIEVDCKPAPLSALAVGQEVEAVFNPDTLVAYDLDVCLEENGGDADDDHEVRGTVSAVDLVLGTITIAPDNVTLTVTAGTRIEVNSHPAALADITVGMPVEAEYDENTLTATEIDAGTGTDSDPEDGCDSVEGVVTAVTGDTVTFLPDEGGAAITLTVTPATRIEVNCIDGTLADILPGYVIEAEYDPVSLEAISLEAESAS
jgi:hypothetical protein